MLDHPNTIEQQIADLQKLLSASDLLPDIMLDICVNIGKDKTHLLAAFSAAATTALYLKDDTVRDGLLVAWDIVNRTDATPVFSMFA